MSYTETLFFAKTKHCDKCVTENVPNSVWHFPGATASNANSQVENIHVRCFMCLYALIEGANRSCQLIKPDAVFLFEVRTFNNSRHCLSLLFDPACTSFSWCLEGDACLCCLLSREEISSPSFLWCMNTFTSVCRSCRRENSYAWKVTIIN